MGAPERAVLIVNPAAGQRHAEDGDLAECVRLLGAAGFDIDRRDTGAEGPTSADLAKSAVADGFRELPGEDKRDDERDKLGAVHVARM